MSLSPRSARWLLAAFTVALVAGIAWLAAPLRELTIRVNDLDFLPRDSPVLAVDQEVRTTFGSDDRLVLVFESRQGLTVTDPRFRSDLGFFVAKLTESFNLGQLLLDRLYRPRFDREPRAGEPFLLHEPTATWVERALDVTAVTGQLAASRSRQAVFLEMPSLSAGGVASIEARVAEAEAALAAERPGAYRVRLLGRQIVLNELGKAIFDDLRALLPGSFLVIALLFWLLFRSWGLVGLALLQSGLTVVATLAIQERLGHPLSLMTALIPVLVTVLGIADEIHFFGTFLRLQAAEPAVPRAVHAWTTLRRLFFPCTAITLTTVIGFASFWVSEAPALQVFGLMAGIGLAVSWLISVTLVPAFLGLVPLQGRLVWAGPAGPTGRRVRSPRLAALVVASLVLVPGVLRLEIDDGWTRNFAPDHPRVEDVRWFERESIGLYQVDLVLTLPAGESWTAPARLAQLEALTARLRGEPQMTAALSLADLVRDRAWELGDPEASRPSLPTDPARIVQLLGTYRTFNEEVFRRLVLDREGGSTRVMLALADDRYETAQSARAALDRAVAEAFPGGEVRALVGGSAERGRVLIDSIVRSQGSSVALSLAVSLLVLGLASGDWGKALRCIGANVWALALVLGLAGWWGLSLGVASSSFLALGVGIGLDYAIHLGFQHHSSGEDGLEVLRRVAANVVVVGAGLLVLLASANPTIAKLGLLIVLSLVASAVTSAAVFRGHGSPPP